MQPVTAFIIQLVHMSDVSFALAISITMPKHNFFPMKTLQSLEHFFHSSSRLESEEKKHGTYSYDPPFNFITPPPPSPVIEHVMVHMPDLKKSTEHIWEVNRAAVATTAVVTGDLCGNSEAKERRGNGFTAL